MLRLLPQPLGAFVAFLVLVAATNLLDYLPAARAEIKVQAAFNLGNALWRAACILAGASIGSIAAVCWALLVYATGRFVLQAVYVARSMPLRDGGFDRLRFRTQFAYAAPFGIASGFWALRGQAEQWVGAGLLAPRAYASLSIAGSITPIVMLVHQAITASSVSAINRLESQGDVTGMAQINARANVLAASYLFPVLTFFFVTSGPLFRLVYTASYADAALVTKLLCIGFIASAIEVSTLTKALRMRRAVLLFDASMLGISVAASVAGALVFGLVGVVIGSVISRYVSTAYFVTVLVRRTGVPWRVPALGRTGPLLRGGLPRRQRRLACTRMGRFVVRPDRSDRGLDDRDGIDVPAAGAPARAARARFRPWRRHRPLSRNRLP